MDTIKFDDQKFEEEKNKIEEILKINSKNKAKKSSQNY